MAGGVPQGPVKLRARAAHALVSGATSKIVLAHLPSRMAKILYSEQQQEIEAVGLGGDLGGVQVASSLATSGACIARGHIDPGRVVISAPIVHDERAIIGSLSFVLPPHKADETLVGRLLPLTIAGASEMERAMVAREESAHKEAFKIRAAR